MENTGSRPAHRARSRGKESRWPLIAAAVLPVLACFLGGATEKWAEGVVLLLFAALLIVAPPRFSPGWPIHAVSLGVIAVCATAFLPADWFFQPAWRAALLHDFNIALPRTLSPQPWVTAQNLLSFVAGIAWLYYVCGRDAEAKHVRAAMRVFAGGIAALAALCVALHFAHTTVPFWHTERNFGPFPNRNQTADLFAITAVVVLASAAEDLRKGKTRWIAWTAALGVLAAAIFINYSRAGIILLIAGVAVWFGVMTLRKGSVARIAVGACVLLALLTSILLFGGETLERFHLRTGGTGMSGDFRWLIFRDTLQLIRESPWCGVGLGNFEPVFAIFRNASAGDTRAHHPESDWLWLWAEAGWIALLLAIIGAGLLLWRALPRGESRNYRMRLAGFVAALIFAIHGTFDVSAHRIGTAMSAVLLLGLALARPLRARSRVLPIVFRALGVVLLVAGGAWAFAAKTHRPLPGSAGAEMLRQTAVLANRSRNFSEAETAATCALVWAPLDWQLYFVRALAEANERKFGEALADFRRARFLEPNAYEVPFDEGQVWATIQPTLALTAWRETLRRAGPQRADAYGRMLAYAEQFNPRLIAPLHDMSRAHRELVLTYLDRLRGDLFRQALDELLAAEPDLESLSANQRAQLIELWAERGDLARLASTVERHPDWLPAASAGIAKYRAQQRDFRGAIELALRFGIRPALPQTPANSAGIDDLQKSLAADPRNYAIGFALYRQQKNAGRIDDALDTLRHFTSLPRPPAYFYFLESEAWAARQDWERAWDAYLKFESAVRK